MGMQWSVLVSALVLFGISRIWKLREGLKSCGWLPGKKIAFQPLAFPGAFIPTNWWNPGLSFTWKERRTIYRDFNSEMVSYVPFMAGQPVIYTSSIEVAKQVVGGGIRSPWIKPESASQIMLLWGMNLIASERETWRRHRRIMAPPFNNPKTYALAWDESMRIYRDMVHSEGWDGKDVINVSTIQHHTFNFTLLVICACGFGWPFGWTETREEKDEGRMSLQQALRTFASSIILGQLPKWAYKVPVKTIQDVAMAKETLERYMVKQIKERKEEVRSRDIEEVGKDMFSLLVQANETDGKFQLDDSELVGNVFGLLFAGHETTAHTLAATLGFLGIYPDIQKEVYKEIVDVVGLSRDPTYEDMPKLEKVRAVFFESVRLYPAGYVMIREATEDTVITIPTNDTDGGESGSKTVPIGKGAQIVVDMVGVQYNHRYFPDPETFKPSRWYGVPLESESVTAFSIGPRTCLGRKFATVEAVCFLALLLRDWEVRPVFKAGEGPEEYRERMMQAKVGLTLGVEELPVTLVRRAARR